MVLLALWAVINGMLLAGWAVQCWNLEQVGAAMGLELWQLERLVVACEACVREAPWPSPSLPGPLPPRPSQGAEATTASMTALSTINTHYAHTVADFASTINSLPQAAAQAAPERESVYARASGCGCCIGLPAA